MTTILDFTIPRTLDRLVVRFLKRPPRGPIEAWLFEDVAARRDAERRLAAAGVIARFRSAYKPLVHFFLEDVDLTQVVAAEIRYPRHRNAQPDRFLRESYPLAALLPRVTFKLIRGGEELSYDVTLHLSDGSTSRHAVFAPNVVRPDHLGKPMLANTGWLKTKATDKPIATEFEALFWKAITTVGNRFGRKPRPPFDRLRVHVETPGEDVSLPYWKETVSFREAMHEDLFFAIRERLGATREAMAKKKGARPGQVVPDIRPLNGMPRLRLSTERFDEARETAGPVMKLTTADRPLAADQVRKTLAAMRGTPIVARSHEGREIRGLYRRGRNPAVLITSGQHANETTGVIGALRAAKRLARDPDAHFAVVPMENADGYELHQRLIVDHPHHMHHAARFTALGDDLWFYPKSPVDQTARIEALRLSGAGFHLNLHGYPAHEWTRPLTGYLPRGYAMWTLPKGFFLIINHHPGWKMRAFAMMKSITAALSADRKLVAFNARQMEIARAHMHKNPFAVMNGFPYLIRATKEHPMPLTLITEAPDETIYGDDFVLLQTAQMNTVIQAVAAYYAVLATRRTDPCSA